MLFFSCTNTSLQEERHNSNRIEVFLIDSMGRVTFNSPDRYDTSFSWTHYSDCNSCHEQKYRFQSKQNVILKESGFYWNDPDDSVDRFTISYKKYFPFNESDTSKDLASHAYFKKDLMFTRKKMEVVRDTIYKINDRYFSIFELENSDSIIKKEVLAITTINGNPINFSCELMTGKNDSISRYFFKSSISLINSIIIKNGKVNNK